MISRTLAIVVTLSREAYFYDAGYTHNHLPLTAYTHGMPTVEEPVHDLSNPIQVMPSGKCVLPDYKPLNPPKQENGEKKKRVTFTWVVQLVVGSYQIVKYKAL